MKTVRIFILILMVVNFTSCEKQELVSQPEINLPQENILPKGNDIAQLSFSIETEQDQMGNFAENAMTVFNGQVWSVGGVNDYGTSDSHFLWNSTNGINWATVPLIETAENFANHRIGHTLTVFNDMLFIIGGKNASEEDYANIWKSTDGTTWTESSAPFGGIPEHSTLVLNNTMYVIAGNSSTRNTEIWSTTDGSSWNLINTNALPGRAGQKGVVFNNTMYVIGGEDIANNKLNDIWSSTDGVNWTQIDTPFEGRNAHTATVYNDKVWIIGGKDSSSEFNNEIWFSENMMDWTRYEGPRPGDSGINSHNILAYDGDMWLFGGYQDDGSGHAEARGEITSITEY
ncbi:MAG: hypothetical protein AB8B59_03280 [Maribacter sp.]